MFRTVFGLTLVAVLCTAGCSEFQQLSMSARNHKAASGAWKQARWDYWQQGVPHKIREHLGRGFEQGYYDVASGGSGQVPLFPPSYYWGPKYQTSEGSAYIGAWFRGYQDGAMAAERDGLSMYNQIPTSWSPAMQQGAAANTGGVPGLPPGLPTPEGEAVPPPPNVDFGPMVPPVPVPVQPQGDLPTLTEPMPKPLVVPIPPSTTPPAPAATPATPGKTTAVPPMIPPAAGGSTELKLGSPAPATGSPPAGAAKPADGTKPTEKPAVPTTPTLRDPVGGKQTLLLPEEPSPPVAQSALFGDSIEAAP